MRIRRELARGRCLYLMLLPVLLFYILFHYLPMGGAVIAFKAYKPLKGIFGSPWIGFDNFLEFFRSVYFVRLLLNTVLLSLCTLLFAFPVPIILALLFNELRNRKLKRTVQTLSYLPHFISTVVVCGMIVDFLSSAGAYNAVRALLGLPPRLVLLDAGAFRGVYVLSEVWQECGWNSIIYLAAITGIDAQIYEAALVDGAGRFQRLLHITLPGLAATIAVLLVLHLGRTMSVGFEKVLLLQNPMNYETSDIISTYIYQRGIQMMDFSYSTAIGLFNNVINCVLLVSANAASRKLTDYGIW